MCVFSDAFAAFRAGLSNCHRKLLYCALHFVTQRSPVLQSKVSFPPLKGSSKCLCTCPTISGSSLSLRLCEGRRRTLLRGTPQRRSPIACSLRRKAAWLRRHGDSGGWRQLHGQGGFNLAIGWRLPKWTSKDCFQFTQIWFDLIFLI